MLKTLSFIVYVAMLVFGMVLVSGVASAVIYFNDSFNRADGSVIGNGWTETVDNVNWDADILSNELAMSTTPSGTDGKGRMNYSIAFDTGATNFSFKFKSGVITGNNNHIFFVQNDTEINGDGGSLLFYVRLNGGQMQVNNVTTAVNLFAGATATWYTVNVAVDYANCKYTPTIDGVAYSAYKMGLGTCGFVGTQKMNFGFRVATGDSNNWVGTADEMMVQGDADTTAPTITTSTFNVTSALVLAQQGNWRTDTTNAVNLTDTTPTVVFSTGETSECAMGLSSQNFSAMIGGDGNTACGSGNATSHSCTLPSTQVLLSGADDLYVSCKDLVGNEPVGNSTSGALATRLFLNPVFHSISVTDNNPVYWGRNISVRVNVTGNETVSSVNASINSLLFNLTKEGTNDFWNGSFRITNTDFSNTTYNIFLSAFTLNTKLNNQSNTLNVSNGDFLCQENILQQGFGLNLTAGASYKVPHIKYFWANTNSYINFSTNYTVSLDAPIYNSEVTLTKNGNVFTDFSYTATRLLFNHTHNTRIESLANLQTTTIDAYVLTYNSSNLTVGAVSTVCGNLSLQTGQCNVSFTIENNNTFKIEDIPLYFGSDFFPNFDDRELFTVFWNLDVGSGGGSYLSSSNFNGLLDSSNVLACDTVGGVSGDGANDGNQSTTSASNLLNVGSASTGDYVLGSVYTIQDVGANSRYNFFVQYNWNLGGVGGFGGGGGGGVGGTIEPLVIGNFSIAPSRIDLPFFALSGGKVWTHKLQSNVELASCDSDNPNLKCSFDGGLLLLEHDFSGNTKAYEVVSASVQLSDVVGNVAVLPVTIRYFNLMGSVGGVPMILLLGILLAGIVGVWKVK